MRSNKLRRKMLSYNSSSELRIEMRITLNSKRITY